MDPPLGVKLVSILTGLYGGVWLLVGLLWANYPEPSVWAALGPPVGVALVLLAAGLWQLRPVAWGLALALYVAGLVWTTSEVLAGNTSRLLGVFTGVLILGYLIAARGRFSGSRRSDSGAE